MYNKDLIIIQNLEILEIQNSAKSNNQFTTNVVYQVFLRD